MSLQLRHFLFAVILGVCVGCVGLIRSRAPIIMIPLALAGLYVATVTTAHDGHVAAGIVRGGVISGLILLSGTALLAAVTLTSRYLPQLGIAAPSKAAFETVWTLGGLMLGFWFLLGVVGKVLGRR